MRRLWIAALVCYAVGSARAQERDFSATGVVLAGDYSTAGAMEAVYGNYDAESQSSVWRPKQHGAAYDKQWLDTVRVRLLREESYTDDGVARTMLVTWAKPDADAADSGNAQYGCHACGVLVGVSIFNQGAGGWTVETSDLQLQTVGVFGQPPITKLLRLGAHAYGLELEIGDTHQGEIERAMWIYAPKAGRMAEWWETKFASDAASSMEFNDDWCRKRSAIPGDISCVWNRMDYAMAPAAGAAMYELEVTKRIDQDRVVVSRWKFNGTRFAEAEK